jgi:ABC-2 type transport system ATP-binding protein
VPRGMIFAILGPNGAGKTTLMRMLATLSHPDAGSATVMGHDLLKSPHAVRGSIAMTGQFASLDEDLTGRENLVLLARLWGFRGRAAKGRADDLLEAFGLSEAAAKQVKNYSGGMRRRLDIAASLIVTPGVLFLDEPTTGLDPNARKDVWKMIRGLAVSGVTILLTTQYLEEADQLAARIAVIDHGKKIAEGSSRELKAATGSGFLHVALADPARLNEAATILERRLGHPVQRSTEGAELSVLGGTAQAANEALAELIVGGIELSDFSMGQPSLEEVFFALTGQPRPNESQKDEAA